MAEFDLVIRGGTAATAADVFRADVGVRGGRIVALAINLPAGRRADADLAVWDANHEVTIANDILHHNVDYTPYEGMRARGWPVTTVSRSEIIWSDGQAHAPGSHGQFLRCGPPQSISPRDGQEA